MADKFADGTPSGYGLTEYNISIAILKAGDFIPHKTQAEIDAFLPIDADHSLLVWNKDSLQLELWMASSCVKVF